MVYQFRKGSRVSGVKAQDVGEVLAGIREKHGMLETEMVLQEASKKRSKIHAAFEWDDGKAGHEFRLIQARKMIRSISVILEDGDEPAYVHVKIDNDNYYQSTSVAAENVDEWQLVHRQALRMLQSASDNLDQLDQVSKRVKHKNSKKVGSVKDVVARAEEQLASL
jgi:hypothetical protein